jgi:ABC-2 type transport system permease protein
MAKILPILFFGAVMVPAIVFIIIAATTERLIGVPLDIPGHADYYEIVSLVLLLFSAVIAPELLCPDRRSGVITLYLVRSLTFSDYVLGRWLAFFVMSLLFIYTGQVVLMVGLTMSATEPLEYLRDNWADIPRFLAAGLVIAIMTTTIPLAAAAFTTRRVYASAFVIGLWLITAASAGILVGGFEDTETRNGAVVSTETTTNNALLGDTELAPLVALLDIGSAPIHISDMIFDKKDNSNAVMQQVAKLPMIVVVLWYVVIVGVPGYLLWNRYRRLLA